LAVDLFRVSLYSNPPDLKEHHVSDKFLPRSVVMVSFRGLLSAVALSSTTLSQPQSVLQSPIVDACSYESLIASHTFENTAILEVIRVPAHREFPVSGTCQQVASSVVDICRIYGIIWTSPSSSVRFEVWLPNVDHWHGRFLTTGNGGMNGCECDLILSGEL
jgi:hypothetical protein